MIQWQNLYKLDVPVAANAKPNYLYFLFKPVQLDTP